MAELSPNLGLNLPVGSDRFDYDKFLRQNFQILDDKVGKSTTEVLTATEGQTVFTLSNPYALGTDSLSVEVDGVKQLIGSGYTETSTTSITLSEPLVAGAKVKVVILGLDQGQDNRLEEKVSYPILAWEYVGGVTIVADKTLPYGNVKRYGAVTDDNTDNGPILQKAFDVCSLNGQIIYFPPGVYKTRTPIKLYECFDSTTKRAYKIKGENTEFSAYSLLSPKCYIHPTTDLFTNDGTTTVPSISIDMRDMFIRFQTASTMFKNMRLRGSYFARTRVDNAYIWLKGSLEEVSLVENSVFYSIKKNFIAETDYATTSAYFSCSDSVVKQSYISGDPTQNAEMISVYNYDVDMIMQDNFIDYFAYLYTPALANPDISIGIFKDNIINRCFRIQKGNVRYGVFSRNTLEYCQWGSYTNTAFTNPLAEMTTGKWGGFILDENNPSTIKTLILYDNTCTIVDSLLYFVSTNTNQKYVQQKLYERGSVDGSIVVQQVNNNNAFSNTQINSLNNATIGSYSDVVQTLNSHSVITAYEGQRVWMAGVSYTAHLVGSTPVWVATDGSLGKNKQANINITSGATYWDIGLPKTEPDNGYLISIATSWNTSWWYSSKTTSSFRINFGTAPASASTLDWSIKR